MLETGSQISVYKIKEILGEDSIHTCCLTEDPFFNRDILLKIYPVSFLYNKEQRDNFETQFENLFHLEHPSIAPVFDSGFAEEYFYYTTSYNYETPLLEPANEAPTSETILAWVRDIANAYEYATARGLEHGHLAPSDLFVGEEGQVVIADFGVSYNFNYLVERGEQGWTETETLTDLGLFLLQLLRPSSQDIRGRERELLDSIDNKQLKQLTARFFPENSNSYQSFAELLSALDELLEQPPTETRPMVQQKKWNRSTIPISRSNSGGRCYPMSGN